MEAHGFIFGAAVARRLGIGFVPIRKPGRIPVETISVAYDLEYGSDRLEMDPSLVNDGERVAILDDLIATGGTAMAVCDLLERACAAISLCSFIIELTALNGARRLRDRNYPLVSLLQFGSGVEACVIGPLSR